MIVGQTTIILGKLSGPWTSGGCRPMVRRVRGSGATGWHLYEGSAR
ncbi:MAG TPA: hypothetical protein VH063_11375 [Gaiellaceae bacterium]|jgi:hypothetical protein|nr:hypothetical protein [Gaiellaceae bacterium]